MLDGVSALPEGLVSPRVSHCIPSCFSLLDGVSACPRVLSPSVSHCAPSCFPLLDGVSAFLRVLSPFVSHCTPSCFPLLDGVSAFLRVLSPFVSHCTPSCFPLLDGSPFWGSRLPLSPIVPLLVSLCWMVRLPPIVPKCVTVLDGVSARGLVCPCLPSCLSLSPVVLIVSQCLPTCVPVLDGVSAFPRSCLPLSPIVSPHVRLCVRRCVRLLEVLSPIVSLRVSVCWMVCPPSKGLSPLSPSLSPSLSSFLSTSLSPNLSFFLFPLGVLKVSWGVRLGVGWCVRLPEVLSPPCLPACLSSCFPLWRVVLFCIFFPSSVRLGFLMLSRVFDPVPQKQLLNPLTVWGLRWCNFLHTKTIKTIINDPKS